VSYSDVVSNGCAATKTVWRTWTATDACGNTTNGLQIISVIDTTKPNFSCPRVSVQCVTDIPAVYADLTSFLAAGGTATDSCSSALTFSQISDSGLVGRCPGTVTRVYRVTDVCGNFAEEDPCRQCSDPQRDGSVVCVVEQPVDVLAFERTGQFRGRYHVLGGALSPLDGTHPEDLRIRPLLERLRREPVKEIILATNPNVAGEATALYLSRLLTPLGIRITRIARGVPMGSDLEYSDLVTLARALEGRREFD